MRRVVVTGLGMVSPLGCGVEPSWKRLLEGKSGAGLITHCDMTDISAKIGCEVLTEDRWGDGHGGLFDANDWIPKKEQRRVDRFIQYGMAAATQAIEDSGYKAETDEQQFRSGTYIGSGIGGLPSIEATSILLHEQGPRKVSPFFITSSLVNLVSGQVSIQHSLKGPNHANATACSTGAHAIGDAARLIALDDADVMVAGGAEAAICRVGMAGFAACRALSTNYNDDPTRASRPYDKDRDGFVMGEGAGVVVLEELEHARARGANIYAEVIGYGLSGDAFHITAPSEDGEGGYRCMQAAMKRAGVSAKDIDYVNAHGTSTKADGLELGSVERLLGEGDIVMSSTKSSIGHLLGAAGAVEAIFSILAMRDNIAPPTINLDNPEFETSINLSPLKPTEKEINTVLSNSFGFGGTNASLILTSNIA